MNRPLPSFLQVLALVSMASALPFSLSAQSTRTITGQNAFTDYSQEHPGVRRKITVADLPAPAPEQSVDNGADMVPRPDGAWPQAPKGFKVELYAQDFKQPRYILTAPNGDLFVADSAAGEVKVLRGVTADGKVKTMETYA